MEHNELNGINGRIGSSLMLFLTGLGAGVALTVLLAPRSGAATRKLIGSKVDEGKGWMKGKAAVAQAYVKGRGEELRGRVEEVAEVIGRPLGTDPQRP
jgi:gas vesicle protein